MSRQYHFSPGDIEFTVLDKENADLGDIEIYLFYVHKPYTGTHLASDLAFAKLTNKFSLTSTLYLAAVLKIKKNSHKNVKVNINFKNGKTIKI